MPRLFVALRPPAPVREALLAAADDDPGIRWQDEDQLHLTLAFLGEVDPRLGGDLVGALAAVRSAPFALFVRGVGHFERKGVPSALWAGLAPSEPARPAARPRRRGLPPRGDRARPPRVPSARHPRPAGPLKPAGRRLAGRARDARRGPLGSARFRALREPPVPGRGAI